MGPGSIRSTFYFNKFCKIFSSDIETRQRNQTFNKCKYGKYDERPSSGPGEKLWFEYTHRQTDYTGHSKHQRENIEHSGNDQPS